MGKKSVGLLDAAVDFSTVSIGDETASIGVRISRDTLDVDEALHLLCGKRLDVRLVAGDESAGQEQLFENALTGSADVKRIGIDPKRFSARLTFAVQSVDVPHLGGLAKRTGRIRILGVAEIPERDGKGEGELAQAEA